MINQPWRSAIAVGELMVAGLLVLLALQCWRWGIVPTGSSEPGQTVLRYLGSWLSLAIGSMSVAGLLVVDALRQLLLAMRVRARG